MNNALPHAKGPFWSDEALEERNPVFFPSVSSLKTPLPPLEHVRLLKALRRPRFLVSAYDVANACGRDREEFIRTLFECRGAGIHVLLDSGNYEAYWSKDDAWSQPRFHEVLSMGAAGVAFSFDQQLVPDNIAAAAEAATKNAVGDASVSQVPIVPIVHGPSRLLPEVSRAVVEATGASAIALPERELGHDVVERFKTLRAIRDAVGTHEKVRLHLLGTGNPLSMLIYAYGGADSFDGLEWCQTVVDHETGLLHHLSHYPKFRTQTEWGYADLHPVARALAHNLEFFAKWETILAMARESETLEKLAAARAPWLVEAAKGA